MLNKILDFKILAAWLLSIGFTSPVGDGIAILALHSEGQVHVRFTPDGGSGLLQPMSMLPPGAQIILPPDGSARVLCGNNKLVELKGPQDWSADEKRCRGNSLQVNLFEKLMASASPISVTQSSDAVVKTRVPSPESLLWILSPRGSTRRERPQLRWSAPRNAGYFQWELSAGASTLARKAVRAHALCRVVGPDRSVCSMDYPAIAPSLAPGRLMDLKVTMLGADLRPTEMQEQASFELLAPEAVQNLKAQLALLAQAPLGPAAACLSRSRLLETRGVLGEAIESLQDCSEAAHPAALDRPLARLYLNSELARAALPHLESLAGQSADPCQRAQIDLGFGRAYFLLGEHRRADSLLRSSVTVLEGCGTDAPHGRKWIEDNKQYLVSR